MYNTSNPAELYVGTTWELLPDNKFLKTGSSPLVQGGSNSVKIAKANLPADKLQVESHSHTQPKHTHRITVSMDHGGDVTYCISGDNVGTGGTTRTHHGSRFYNPDSAGGENTGSSAPYTAAMGSGTPLSINPEHITVKAWKRLT